MDSRYERQNNTPASQDLVRLFSQARQLLLEDDLDDPRSSQGVRALVQLGQEMGILSRKPTSQPPQSRIVR